MSDLAERRARIERERKRKGQGQQPPEQPGGGSLKRITVNLTPRSVDAMRTAVELTGDSRTDIINRAVQVYAEILQVRDAGGAWYARPEKDADLQELRIL
ncbi:hypothetical protein [Streptomyces sp. TLI_185]|uniref:hypothetical protein n=1 Tax=Streptomyces sp. TLI_185 TaxID=2485151 RepID=UPI000FB87557|nr:hypothetical protein [Streptomyces sp. TLI_185]RPF33421.1 hypothetical protein EDD92_3333 [Streptomyces sp. TLI_185]